MPGLEFVCYIIIESNFLAPIWVFPKIGVPQNGWFIRENPIKMDDLGVPLFLETPIFISHIFPGKRQPDLSNHWSPQRLKANPLPSGRRC